MITSQWSSSRSSAVATGRATVESVELRDLKKRNRLSDQENEVHRAAAYLVRDINQI